MNYLSVCSGIEAATVAWHPLGWSPVAFSEIERFPSAVLSYHYPDVPNWGDMTHFKEWPDADIDVLVGGTPCQSYSVAGLRAGLDDPRGELMLTYGAIASRYRPNWVVWENVPGVLSSNGGRDFGTFLGLLAELGYGFAYRVLDAQYVRTYGYEYAVPQRRRRVFVVGCLGGWRRAGAVLFERESMLGNPPPRRESGPRVTGAITAGTHPGGLSGQDVYSGLYAYGGNNTTGPIDVSTALRAKGGTGHNDFESETFVAHTLRGEGFDASEDGTGRGVPLTVIPILEAGKRQGSKADARDGTGVGNEGDPMYTLQAGAQHGVAYGFQPRIARNGRGNTGDVAGALNAQSGRTGKGDAAPCVAIAFHGSQDPDVSGDVTHPVGRNQGQETCALIGARVRRLTPR